MFVMTLYRLLVVTVVGAIVVASTLSGVAFALPAFLPSGRVNSSSIGNLDSGKAILETSAGTELECTTAPSRGGGETDTLGTFRTAFEGCESSGFKCKTTGGSVSGQIVSEGSFSFVYDTLGTGETLGIAILFSGKVTEFECAGGLVKNIIRGLMLCLVLAPLSSSITHLFHCLKGSANGTAGVKRFYNDSGTIVEATLEANQNGSGFKEVNLQALATENTPEAGAWMNE
jgi:hypothetical protein